MIKKYDFSNDDYDYYKVTPKSGAGNKYWNTLKKIDTAGYKKDLPENKKYSTRSGYTNLSDTYTITKGMSWPEMNELHVSYKKRKPEANTKNSSDDKTTELAKIILKKHEALKNKNN